jgi:hypothetical protein
MQTTQESTVNSLLKLSNELRATHDYDDGESDSRLAYLHAMAFHETSSNLILAIKFTIRLYRRIYKRLRKADEAIAVRLNALLSVVHDACIALYAFTDELRAEFDQHRLQQPLRIR